MSHLDMIAQIICETNDPDRWRSIGRYEKERRKNEADAVVQYIKHILPLKELEELYK